MAEIKSTIDIVMEKTRHMVQTPEERAREKAEEMEKRAKGLALKLTDSLIDPTALAAEIDAQPDEDRAQMKAVLFRTLIGDVSLESISLKILAGLEAVAPDAMMGSVRQAEAVIEEYEGRHQELAEGSMDQVMAELAAMGVTGSALKPKSGAAAGSAGALDDLQQEYTRKLEALKQEMIKIGS